MDFKRAKGNAAGAVKAYRFDKNPSFGELKSVQITGKAAIIELMFFNQGRSMHLICITPVKMDVLFSDFKKQGYDVRQVLEHTGK